MQFSTAVTTTTREKIVPKVFDTITKGTPGLMLFLRNPAPWKSGTEYDVIYKYADSTNGGNTGIADTLDTDREDVRVKGLFYPKTAYKPVVVADIETELNKGDERIVDLLTTEFDSQAQSLIQLMSANLYSGTGVGNSWDSLDNAADDSTNYATYATLARATYTTLKGYYLASAGALTLAKMATGYDSVAIGMDNPTDIITTKPLWSSYEALLTPTVRSNYAVNGNPRVDAFGIVTGGEGGGGNIGFETLAYRGTPVIKDEQVASGRMYFVNRNFFGFKGISRIGKGYQTVNFKKNNDGVPMGVVGRVKSTLGFNFRDMMSPTNQLAQVGIILYDGNFISENPRLQGQIRGLS